MINKNRRSGGSLPDPIPGLVIRYAYLWHAEHVQGREEGVKDRPCAVTLVIRMKEGRKIAMVLPVTHTPPDDPATALEIPAAVKARLGLDSERSWIVLTELNQFSWPGPDLRTVAGGDLSTIAYGMLPPNFFRALRARFADSVRRRRMRIV